MARHILSIKDFSLEELLQLTRPDAAASSRPLAIRGTLALFFQQASVRTLSSFARAGVAVGLVPVPLTVGKDAFRDQARIEDEVVQLGLTSTAVVVRSATPLDRTALTGMRAPLVNGGDGSNEHPTQTLLDIASLRAEGGLEHQRITIMGNLRDHRVSHSLLLALDWLGVQVTLLCPPERAMDRRYLRACQHVREIIATDAREVDEVLAATDRLYQTPLKFWNSPDDHFDGIFDMTLSRAERVLPAGARIFHPFPRVGELAADLDGSRFDAYQDQAARGPEVRRRLLAMLLKD